MKKVTKRFMSACAAVALAAVMAFGGIGTSVANAAAPANDFDYYAEIAKAEAALEEAKLAVEEQITFVEENYEAMYAQAYADLEAVGYIATAKVALEVAAEAVDGYALPEYAIEEIEKNKNLTDEEKYTLIAEFNQAKKHAVEVLVQAAEDIVSEDAKDIHTALELAMAYGPTFECAYGDLLVAAEAVSPAVKADLQVLYDEYAPQIKAAIDEFITAANEKLAEIEATIKAEIAKQLEALQKEIEKLENAIKAEIERIEAELEEKLDELKDQLEKADAAVRTEIEAAIEAVEKILEKLEVTVAEIEATINEAVEDIETAIEDIDATIAALEAELEAAYADVMAELADAYAAAITGEYVVDEDSLYFAIGDSILSTDGTYADVLAQELYDTYGVEANLQCALDGFRAEDIRYLLDESYSLDAYGVAETKEAADDLRAEVVAEIEAADFITVSFGNDNFTSFVSAQANGADYEMDWARYVTADGVPYVEEALAEVSAKVAAEVPMMAGAVDDLVEAYAYAFAGFAANYAAVLDEIHAINPEAEVVVTGLYNPIDDLTVNDENLGAYVDYFIELSNQMFTIYSMITPNTTFVAIEDTEVAMDAKTPSTMQYVLALMGASEDLLPTEAGHAYIAEQILAAETITVAEMTGLKGDVNLDGYVDDSDVNLLYRYVNKYAELNAQQIENGNVNGDEVTDDSDVNLLYRYVNNYVTAL